MGAKHGWSCGRQLTRRIEANGGTKAEAATAIHEHCRVSLLRAHRAAHGLTLADAAECVRGILREWSTPAEGLAHQQISRWENGLDTPSPHYLKALCYLYRTRPDRLGFGYDFSAEQERIRDGPAHRDPLTIDQGVRDMRRRPLLQSGVSGLLALASSHGLPHAGVPRSWSAQDPRASLAELEESAECTGYLLYSAAPADFVPMCMLNMAAVQGLLLRKPTLDAQRRLYRLIARNAGYIGIRVTDVSAMPDTFNWFRIADQAARQAEDKSLQAWIFAHWSDAYGCFHHALPLGLQPARAAQTLGLAGARSASVYGYLAEAGIQARLGRRREALDAVRRADAMFAALPAAATVEDGTKISEYFLRWHESNALSVVGEDKLAREMRALALAHPFAGRDLAGRALLELDQAAALVRSNDVDAACDQIMETWHELPAEYRSGQVPRRITQIVDRMSPLQATNSSVRALSDYLQSVDVRPARARGTDSAT